MRERGSAEVWGSEAAAKRSRRRRGGEVNLQLLPLGDRDAAVNNSALAGIPVAS